MLLLARELEYTADVSASLTTRGPFFWCSNFKKDETYTTYELSSPTQSTFARPKVSQHSIFLGCVVL